MSAYMVGDEHIDALLTAGLAGRDTVFWYAEDPTDDMTHEEVTATRRVLDHSTADQVGAMLLAENRASVNHRYEEDELEQVYEFRRLPGTPNPVIVLSALACYEYQSCEHPGWKTSEAKRFCDTLRLAMIRRLPGYSDAPWEITDRDVFTSKARTR